MDGRATSRSIRRRRPQTVAPLTLEDRLKRLTGMMGESALLVEQVSAELEAQAATARQLEEEARNAEALVAINREQAEAVRRMIDADLAAGLAKSSDTIQTSVRKDALRIAIGGFIAGGGVTFFITWLVHPLH